MFSIGARLLNTPLTAAVTSGVDREDAGAAAGLMNATKQVGAALGLAVLITVATPAALTGYNRAFAVIAVVMAVVAAAAWLLPGAQDCDRVVSRSPNSSA